MNHKKQGIDVILTRPNGGPYVVTLDDKRDAIWWVAHLSEKAWVTPAMLRQVEEADRTHGDPPADWYERDEDVWTDDSTDDTKGVE